MFPVLFTLGPLVFRTASLFSFLAFFTTAFVFWRKSREEHYSEVQIFDGFLVASVVGFLTGRLGFVFLHYQEFGWQIWKWADLIANPGSSLVFALLGAALYLFRYAQKQKWDTFEILDYWIMGTTAGLVLLSLGDFFNGTHFGTETRMPWGVLFPGVFTPRHPLQLYSALFFAALFAYLSWAEYRYRTFTWYRAGKKTAQTGFLTSIFLILTGIFLLGTQIVRPAQFEWQGIVVDWVLAGLMVVVGLGFLWVRSGRSLLPGRRQHTPSSPFPIE